MYWAPFGGLPSGAARRFCIQRDSRRARPPLIHDHEIHGHPPSGAALRPLRTLPAPGPPVLRGRSAGLFTCRGPPSESVNPRPMIVSNLKPMVRQSLPTALHAVRGRQAVCAGWTVAPPTGHGPARQAEGPVAVIPAGDRLKVSEEKSGSVRGKIESGLNIRGAPVYHMPCYLRWPLTVEGNTR